MGETHSKCDTGDRWENNKRNNPCIQESQVPSPKACTKMRHTPCTPRRPEHTRPAGNKEKAGATEGRHRGIPKAH